MPLKLYKWNGSQYSNLCELDGNNNPMTGWEFGGGEPQNASIVVKSLREKEPALGSFFIGKAPCDTGGGEPEKDSDVVFTQYELDNYGPIEERTEFKNKVEEEIYRTKKHLLKTRGGWD